MIRMSIEDGNAGFRIDYYYFQFNRKLAQNRSPMPQHVTACGSQTGLAVTTKLARDDYHTTFFSSFGLRVFVHDAYDFVDGNAETRILGWKMVAMLSVTPENTFSTDAVRDLPIPVRQCLMPDERKLKFMRSYSFSNCMAECRSDIVFELCGCVPYHMVNNGTYPGCEMSQIVCVVENKHLFSGAMPSLNSGMKYGPIKACDCLPDCDFNVYRTESSIGTINRTFSFNNDAF